MLNRVRQSAFSLLLVLVLGFVMGLGVAAPRAVSGAAGGDGEPDLLKAIYNKVNPSVVTITVRIPASAAASQGLMPVPQGQQGGNLGQQGRNAYAYAAGSGFVYDANGHIVTNEHVVEGADRIEVTFSDDTQMRAKVVGMDADSDVAVISVDGDISKYAPLTIANSDEVAVGDRAIAIGNPFERAGTMTQGIISGIHRSVDAVSTASNGGTYQIPDALQTDAAINPGNSGGPLLNSDGSVIGINEQIASDLRQSSGVSFAIPSNLVKTVADGLIANGKVDHSWLGIAGNSLDLDTNDALKLPETTLGVYVNQVQPNSPADKAGLKGGTDTTSVNGQDITTGGDVITAVDGQTVHHFDDLTSYLFTKTKVGQTITLTVLRNGQTMDIKVTLAARPTSNS